MGLRINTALSMRANTQLQRTQRAIARSLERLGSGLRVNSPRDDAAAYRLGVGLTSQIRGIAAANLGINTALGMIETASSAISTQMDIVQRMRELAVQASNGTMSDTDRANLDLEVQTLYSEYNRITSQTNFNGTNLIDGSFGLKAIQAGANKGDTIQFGINSTDTGNVFPGGVTVGTSVDVTTRVGAGSFTAGQWISISPAGYGEVAAVDFNGDGKLDVLGTEGVNGWSSISLGNGNGTYNTRITFVSGVWPTSYGWVTAAGDINGDGKQDVVVGHNGGSYISIFLGNGNGTVAAAGTIASSTTSGDEKLYDLNGDGKLDLVNSDQDDNTVSVYLGNGNGTFKPRNTFASATVQAYFKLQDMNGDGKVDFVNSWNVLLGNGNGTFGPQTQILQGGFGVDIGDVNGDGKQDVYTTDGFSIYGFLGNGNGTFAQRITITTGTFPRDFVLLDYNGDGRLDLIDTDYGDTTLSFALGNGNGTFGTRTTKLIGSPTRMIAADMNGDGLSDLVFSIGEGSIGTQLMDTTTVTTSTGGTYTSPLGSTSVSVATQNKALAMIVAADAAISSLSSYQANLAAIHSRLNETVAGNLLLSENLSEARSVAIDTDYSLEVADLVKNQILQSAQIAVLTQANMQQDLILKLLENVK